jgi:antitoxin HicB
MKPAMTLEYYRRLPYTLHTEPVRDSNGENYWIAEYHELTGCKTDGNTEAEAVANLQELFDDYIKARLEANSRIPEPERRPVATKEIWIVVPRELLTEVSPTASLEDTQGTKEEVKSEVQSLAYAEMAA